MINFPLSFEIEALINAVVCIVVAGTLMFYKRRGARHRKHVSRLAYLAVLGYASIPFMLIYGLYQSSSWPVVAGNTLICGVLIWHRGNFARIVDHLRGIK
ncbi:phage holin family protein [Trabulsiella odontotermitis]|uniref:phage holin family protein n=1 Tax=Trabulsiella odontotermitis TaxID=379893 RepID=UPI003AD09CDD